MKKGKKMKNKGWIYIILFLIVLGVFSVRIILVNATFPDAENIYISQENSAEIQKYFSMEINYSKWLSDAEKKDKFGDYLAVGSMDDLILEVNVTFENRLSKKKYINISSVYFENTQHYTNGIALELYQIENDNPSLELEMKPKEKITCNLVYGITNVDFTEEQWNNLKTEKGFLVCERYPVKTWWEIAAEGF